MKTISVLGSHGAMGRVICGELSRLGYYVRRIDSATGHDMMGNDFDLEQACDGADVVVSALPGTIGYNVAHRAMLLHGVNKYVDLSFSIANPDFRCDGCLIYDCGFSPGLSHLLVGHNLANATDPKRIAIYVGGIAANQDDDLILTWSKADLEDEYKRRARIKERNEMKYLNPLNPANTKHILLRVGSTKYEFEGFLSDGARSLLDSINCPFIFERTLRWPGHMAKIGQRPADYLSRLPEKGADLFILQVEIDDGAWCVVVHPQDGLSAMARGTALTCCGFVQLLAENLWFRKGCHGPETVGLSGKGEFVLDYLRSFHSIEAKPTSLAWTRAAQL